MEENIKNNIWLIIKNILKWITSPIWFPWKILFVRKETKKFESVNTPTKIFRILRSPITIPLKFILYLVIIILEISLIYQIKNFAIAPFVRNDVKDYYITNNNLEYETMFNIVDDQNIVTKNNFYTVMDSTLIKRVISEIPEDALSNLITTFNNDLKFQEAILHNIENINTVIPNIIKSNVEYNENLEALLYLPALADTSLILDTANTVFELATTNIDEPIFSYIDVKMTNKAITLLKVYHSNNYDFTWCMEENMMIDEQGNCVQTN